MKLLYIIILFITMLSANEKVSIQFKWKHSFQFAGYYIAKELGYYKELGIDVELKEFDNNTNIIDDVMSGKTTFGIHDSFLVNKKMENKDIVALYATFQSSPLVFLSLKEKNILEPEDLIGKIIEYNKSESNSLNLDILLKSQKIDYVRKEPTFKLDDLIKDKTDVVAAYVTDQTYSLEKLGYKYNIIDPANWGYRFYSDILFTSSKLIDQKPQLVSDFYKASIKGWRYALTNVEETAKLIFDKYNSQNKDLNELIYEGNTSKKFVGDLNSFGKIEQNVINNIITAYSVLKPAKFDPTIFNNFIYKSNYGYVNNRSLDTIDEEFLSSNRFNIYFNNWKPFTFIDSSMNEIKGISYDYWKYIEKKININTDKVYIQNWKEVLSKAKEDDKSILLSTSISKDKEKYALFTKPYVSYPISIVTKNDKKYIIDLNNLNGKTIAVGKSFSAYKLLNEHYPKIKYVLVNDTSEALDLVSKNVVYGAADILPVITNYMNSNGYSDLKISANTKETLDLRIMVNKNSSALIDILNEVIDTINEEEKQLIFNKWVNIKLVEKFDNSLFYKAIVIVLILLCFTIYYIYTNYKLKNQNVKINELLKEKESNQKKLIEQSKFAALGEMLDNIAHQWKQPLSVISVSASGMKIKNQYSDLSKEEIIDYAERITVNAGYLSDTIETFRNFLHEEKILEKTNVHQLIEKSIDLARMNAEMNNINFVIIFDKNIDTCVNVIKNEFIQVIMNLIINAKEQFKIKNIKSPKIIIKTKIEDNNVIITIEDNAGGVEEENIDKIFDAYFTTKHQSFGTGIGLYMCKRIMEESFNGELDVVNTIIGAKFIVKLMKA